MKQSSQKHYRYFVLLCLLLMSESCRIFRKQPKQQHSEDQITRIINTAKTYSGVPYRSGGVDYNGVDCSGLLWSVFKESGFKIPRVAWQQAEFFKAVKLNDLKPGDLVFFITTNKGQASTISHSGIVTEVRSAKEVIFIHASSSKGVREDNLYLNYWKSSFAKAIRPFEQ